MTARAGATKHSAMSINSVSMVIATLVLFFGQAASADAPKCERDLSRFNAFDQKIAQKLDALVGTHAMAGDCESVTIKAKDYCNEGGKYITTYYSVDVRFSREFEGDKGAGLSIALGSDDRDQAANLGFRSVHLQTIGTSGGGFVVPVDVMTLGLDRKGALKKFEYKNRQIFFVPMTNYRVYCQAQ